MNHVYKVIWNKSKGMYTVVSELATNGGRCKSRILGSAKILSSAIGALVVAMSLGITAPAYAATSGHWIGYLISGVGVTGDDRNNLAIASWAGKDATATGTTALAIGTGAQAKGIRSISIGAGNVVSGNNSGAIGDSTTIIGSGSYSVGNNNNISVDNTSVDNTFVLGSGVTANVADSVYLGKGSTASATATPQTGGATGSVLSAEVNGVTYGDFAGAKSNGTVTVGAVGTERRVQNVAAGLVTATSTDAINGSQLYAVAEKLNTTITASNTAVTSKDDTVTVKGTTDTTTGKTTYDLSVSGLVYKANGANNQTVSLSKGLDFTNGTNTTAEVGAGGVVKYNLNKDITVDSVTTNTVTTTTVDANTVNATTVNGDTITAGDTVTINSNGIDMGGTKITNLKDGDINANSTDAVTGKQLFNTNRSIEKLGNRVDKVGAGAAALAALHPLDFDPDAKWDFAAGYGNYSGENAVALGAYYRPNEDLMFSIGSTMGNGENMLNAGVSVKVGGMKGVSKSRVAIGKEVLELKQVVAKQDAQIQKLTAMLNGFAGTNANVDTTKLFPDVPSNHWAYEAVAAMSRSGLVEGYPNGTFSGDRMMTRYEFAQIVYRAMQQGAAVEERLVNEFSPEMALFRVDTIKQDKAGNPEIQRVRVNHK